MAIDPLESLRSAGGVGRVDKARQQPGVSGGEGPDFKAFLQENLEKVNKMQVDADEAVHGLMTGEETDITKVMGAVEKADVAFQTLMAVRNKLVESYQEVLRIRL